MTKSGTYFGKNLEDYSKEELLEIIVKMGKYYESRLEQSHKDFEFMADLGRKRF